MGREVFEPIVTIVAGIIGVTIIAVLVSRNAQTANVFAAAGGAFSNVLSTAVSPVTGAAATPNVNAGAGNSNSITGLTGGNIMTGANISGLIP
jgi:PRD1 phage membrane DNA delivery